MMKANRSTGRISDEYPASESEWARRRQGFFDEESTIVRTIQDTIEYLTHERELENGIRVLFEEYSRETALIQLCQRSAFTLLKRLVLALGFYKRKSRRCDDIEACMLIQRYDCHFKREKFDGDVSAGAKLRLIARMNASPRHYELLRMGEGHRRFETLLYSEGSCRDRWLSYPSYVREERRLPGALPVVPECAWDEIQAEFPIFPPFFLMHCLDLEDEEYGMLCETLELPGVYSLHDYKRWRINIGIVIYQDTTLTDRCNLRPGRVHEMRRHAKLHGLGGLNHTHHHEMKSSILLEPRRSIRLQPRTRSGQNFDPVRGLHLNGKAMAKGAESNSCLTPSSINDVPSSPEMNDGQAQFSDIAAESKGDRQLAPVASVAPWAMPAYISNTLGHDSPKADGKMPFINHCGNKHGETRGPATKHISSTIGCHDRWPHSGANLEKVEIHGEINKQLSCARATRNTSAQHTSDDCMDLLRLIVYLGGNLPGKFRDRLTTTKLVWGNNGEIEYNEFLSVPAVADRFRLHQAIELLKESLNVYECKLGALSVSIHGQKWVESTTNNPFYWKRRALEAVLHVFPEHQHLEPAYYSEVANAFLPKLQLVLSYLHEEEIRSSVKPNHILPLPAAH